MGNGFLVYLLFISFCLYIMLPTKEAGEGINKETPLLRCATGSSGYSGKEKWTG